MGYKRIAVVYGVSEPYGEGIAHQLISSLYKSNKTKGSLVGSIDFLSIDGGGNYLAQAYTSRKLSQLDHRPV